MRAGRGGKRGARGLEGVGCRLFPLCSISAQCPAPEPPILAPSRRLPSARWRMRWPALSAACRAAPGATAWRSAGWCGRALPRHGRQSWHGRRWAMKHLAKGGSRMLPTSPPPCCAVRWIAGTVSLAYHALGCWSARIVHGSMRQTLIPGRARRSIPACATDTHPASGRRSPGTSAPTRRVAPIRPWLDLGNLARRFNPKRVIAPRQFHRPGDKPFPHLCPAQWPVIGGVKDEFSTVHLNACALHGPKTGAGPEGFRPGCNALPADDHLARHLGFVAAANHVRHVFRLELEPGEDAAHVRMIVQR